VDFSCLDHARRTPRVLDEYPSVRNCRPVCTSAPRSPPSSEPERDFTLIPASFPVSMLGRQNTFLAAPSFAPGLHRRPAEPECAHGTTSFPSPPPSSAALPGRPPDRLPADAGRRGSWHFPSPSRCPFAAISHFLEETHCADWLGELVPERSDGRVRDEGMKFP